MAFVFLGRAEKLYPLIDSEGHAARRAGRRTNRPGRYLTAVDDVRTSARVNYTPLRVRAQAGAPSGPPSTLETWGRSHAERRTTCTIVRPMPRRSDA
jgi:hypothetical protein